MPGSGACAIVDILYVDWSSSVVITYATASFLANPLLVVPRIAAAPDLKPDNRFCAEPLTRRWIVFSPVVRSSVV